MRLILEGERNGVGLQEISHKVGSHKLDQLDAYVDPQSIARLRAETEHFGLSAPVRLGRAAFLQNICLYKLRNILEDGGHTQGQLLCNILSCHGLSAPHQLKDTLLNSLRHCCTHFTKTFY